MLRYIIHRIYYLIPTLLFLSLIVFTIIRLVPGDPVDYMLASADQGGTIDNITREIFRKEYGLDKPLPIQYVYWVWKAIQLDLGDSIIQNRPVSTIILERLPATVYLAISSICISMSIAIPAGIIAAVKRKKLADYAAMTFAMLGVTIPNFWLGIMLILLFSLHLRWLPSMGYAFPSQDFLGFLKHLILPSLSLGMALAGSETRMTRSMMLDELRKEYVQTARSKGLPEKVVIFKHALHNALIPVVTIVGLQVGRLLGGTVVIETVFSWPGTGQLLVQSIYRRDYPMVQGAILFLGLFFVTANLVVDILYKWIDPRVKLG